MTSATGVLVRLRVLTPQLASQVGAPASAWPGSRSLLVQAQSSLSNAQGPAVSVTSERQLLTFRIFRHVTRWDQELQHTTNTDLRQTWGDVSLMSDDIRRRLQWLGHITRTLAIRLPKKLLFGWLSHSRPAQMERQDPD